MQHLTPFHKDDKKNRPLSLYICSWAHGIGGGAARMEAYYMQNFNPDLFSVKQICLVSHATNESRYDTSIPVITLPENDKYQHLVEHLKNADIVQFQGSFDPFVCEAAKAANVPLLVEVLHNIEKGYCFDNIDVSICVSNAILREQDSQAPSHLILNGVDIHDFSFSYKRKRASSQNEKIILLQVANRSKLSIHLDDLAPELNQRFPNLEFWIAGREQNKESKDNIRYFGVTDTIKELYQAADYLILLSQNEPFGLAAVEAMASGCIPILSDTGGFQDIVTDGHDGFLVSTADKQTAIEKISDILTSHTNKQNKIIQQNARLKVENIFDIKDSIKKYENLYLEAYKKKNLKNDLKTPTILPTQVTGDALIGEAVYAFHSANYKKVYQILEKIFTEKTPLKNPLCVEVALDLFQFLYLNNKKDSAVSLMSYLLESSIADIGHFEKWIGALQSLDISDDHEISHDLEVLGEHLVEYGITDQRLIMEYTELLLSKISAESALEFLARVIEKSKNDEILSDYYRSWYEKLSMLPA